MMKRLPITLSCIAVATLVGHPIPARAQADSASSKPSLVETIDYIRLRMKESAVERYNGYASAQHNVGVHTFRAESSSRCVVTVFEHTRNVGTYQDTTTTALEDAEVEIPLWAIDRVSTGTGNGGIAFVQLDAFKFAKLFKVDYKKTSDSPYIKDVSRSYRIDSYTIGFGNSNEDNLDVAKRVGAAFTHARNLCCSEQPTSSDPFATNERRPCDKN